MIFLNKKKHYVGVSIGSYKPLLILRFYDGMVKHALDPSIENFAQKMYEYLVFFSF